MNFFSPRRIVVEAFFLGTFLLAVLSRGNLCQGFVEKKGKPLDSEKAINTLQTSDDGLQLAMAAIAICHFHWDEEMDFLIEQLQKPDFLRKLDDDFISGRFGSQYRLPHILTAIGKISTAKAEKLLFRLADNKEIISNQYRKIALIKAFGWIRDPSPRLLSFLENAAQPNATGLIIYPTIEALARIASPQACQVIEKMVLSQDYKCDKQIWFTGFICPYRNDYNIVQLYKRLINSGLKDAQLRNIIVQSIFDYRPRHWFDLEAGNYLSPPPRENASLEVLQELSAITDLALKLDLNSETKEGVEKAQKEIRGFLRQRQSTTAVVPTGAIAKKPMPKQLDHLPWYGFLIAGMAVGLGLLICLWLARREVK